MKSTGSHTKICLSKKRDSIKHCPDFKIAIAGNPNVGKSTVFNALTGMKQHTGNWPGKTVGAAEGFFRLDGINFKAIDVPGTYSLSTNSPEEAVARDVLLSDKIDASVVVCDATCLERGLILALQIIDLGKPVIICVNLLDEARKKGIEIDLSLLENRLKVPVVGVVARKKGGLTSLLSALKIMFDSPCESFPPKEKDSYEYVATAESVCNGIYRADREKCDRRDRLLDKLFVGKKTAYPIMIALLIFVFWLTIIGANYPSEILSSFLFSVGDIFKKLLIRINCPPFIIGLLIDGAYKTLAWIVSVMLPPMAIFFPLFTLLEDSGYLPRIAFNLDKPFRKCASCGKQALTMCMGFGCNAAGVVGCRIIDSPREQLIAMLTNSLVPCNGRFPLLIALITVFFIGADTSLGATFVSSVLITAMIVICVIATLLISGILSKTVLRGVPSAFTLELPPYRAPQIGKVIVRSIFDRTIFVLGRALVFAIPAGIVLWLMANLQINGSSLLVLCSNYLDPFARCIGLDGTILLAFILALPANELVIPIIIMTYASRTSLANFSTIYELKELFLSNGWTHTTAICTMTFSLFHWPCSTTLLSIKKESGRLKWAILAAIIPTVLGLTLCAAINFASQYL